jgi:D-alanyl-lipoteichoic acid acyltransferase DltB (MBOAT superfamily)
MLFNSLEFIYLFLPLAVLLHFLAARWSVSAAVATTTLSSLVFYTWWKPPFVLLPLISIAGNYWLAREILRADRKIGRTIMLAGVVANLLVLCYFKYFDFLVSIV